MSDTMPEDTTNSPEHRRLQWKAHGDFCRFRSVNDTFRKYCPDMDQKSVLDIGCGRTYPQVLLYTLMGLEAIGIDRGEFAWSTNRQADDLIFFEHLAKMIDRTLDDQAVSLVRTDAARLPFADDRFDFIVSNMVFEHLRDLDAVTDEMARVLKPAGLMNIGIHLYPSLSGQHHPGIWGEEIT